MSNTNAFGRYVFFNPDKFESRGFKSPNTYHDLLQIEEKLGGTLSTEICTDDPDSYVKVCGNEMDQELEYFGPFADVVAYDPSMSHTLMHNVCLNDPHMEKNIKLLIEKLMTFYGQNEVIHVDLKVGDTFIKNLL